ncbi:NAD(P)H-dependent oxidoreductase [Candidatus Kaiserbacteria bacterium]|nr:NAD(P)H-dependent oxidoreductase [Candidatus Kaiserbacteria bacterium]
MKTIEKKKIVVLLGHPDANAFSGLVASTYEAAAREAGHDVERINIGDLHFDPILHRGYKEIQELEPDLHMVQEKINWADHLVVVYPNWWCTMPALLKGLFDRMWLPGFAFNFDKVTKKLIQRLKGKTARVVIIAGTHSPFQTWWKFGDYTNEIAQGTLGFAGFKVRVSSFGPTERGGEKVCKHCLDEMKTLGKKGV